MKARLHLASVAVALMLSVVSPVAAQAPAGYGDIIGSWACSTSTGAGSVEVVTTYRTDGSFISLGTTRDSSSGSLLEFVITVEGRWSIANRQITEVGTDYDLVWARMAGQPVIPGAELWTAMDTAMRGTLGQPNVRTIEALSATSISLDFQGYDITCARP